MYKISERVHGIIKLSHNSTEQGTEVLKYFKEMPDHHILDRNAFQIVVYLIV
jgi:hypothetical protein